MALYSPRARKRSHIAAASGAGLPAAEACAANKAGTNASRTLTLASATGSVTAMVSVEPSR